MGNATIVSIVPFQISEIKPGIFPGFFEIPASKNNEPEVLVIGNSSFHVELEGGRSMTIDSHAEKIAKSIVDDFVLSNLGVSLEEKALPGIFYKEGRHTKYDIKNKFNVDLEIAKSHQLNWFKRLVTMADDDWEKTRQHKCISDTQRHAAKFLNLERPWIINIEEVKVDQGFKCIACYSVISKESIVCPACRCILQPDQYKKLQFATV